MLRSPIFFLVLCGISGFLTGCGSQPKTFRLPCDSAECAELAAFLKQRGVEARPLTSTLLDVPATAESRRELRNYLPLLIAKLRIIENNIVNAETIDDSNGANIPFRRKVATVAPSGQISVDEDLSPFPMKFQPEHPMADQQGYVRLSNVIVQLERAYQLSVQREYSVISKMIGDIRADKDI